MVGVSSEGFNPQRLVGAAATARRRRIDLVAVWFQSSAARRSRCNLRPARADHPPGPVSILSGSSEPLQPPSGGPGSRSSTFQSSAARRSRCNGGVDPAGAGGGVVSILSGSSEPLQPGPPWAGSPPAPVSILSGSSEPLQRPPSQSPLQLGTFQSSAARRSRCNGPAPTDLGSRSPFQSSAARRSRCNVADPANQQLVAQFQSSAARRSRCNVDWHLDHGGGDEGFNPQRLVGAAATPGQRRSCPGPRPCFNPQRLVGAAATTQTSRRRTVCTSFNPQRLVGAAAT